MKNNLSLITLIGILLFSVNSLGQPYCSSSYPNYFTDYISNINFNTISNPSGPTGYSDFTSTHNTDIAIGAQYNLTARIVNFNPTTIYVMAWIDWNQDFDFDDAGESFSLGSVVGPTFGTDVTVSILVPAGASLGTTRMRISASRGFVPTPCNSGGYLFGETEDYSVTIVPSPIYWDGESDTEWNNPLNWDGDVVPDVTDPVLIPGSAPQFPDFSGDLFVGTSFGPNRCKSLAIENGASITITGSGLISIYNNVTINSGGTMSTNNLRVGFGGSLFIDGGTVSVNDLCTFWNLGNMNSGSLTVGGKLEFKAGSTWGASGGVIICKSGSDTEIINASNGLTLYNLIIQSGGTARLSGDSEESIFLVGSFTIEPNAEFTMEAPTGGGNISEITIGENFLIDGSNLGKGSFVDENGTSTLTYGTTTVKSYYVDNRWHFISSPVTSAVSGVFLDLYLKAFDESTNSYTPSPGIVSTTYPLGVGQGFETWSDIGNPTISYVGGQLNTGDLATSFTATDINGDLSIGDGEGWNLIGTPYPSAIDVGTENDPVSGYTWTNIDSTIYAWNGVSWSSFNMAGNGTGVNGGTRYNPSMQGFFLKANDFNPAFSFSNSARLHSTQANYKFSVNDDFQIRLIVNGNGYSDEMIVRAINSATDLFDSKYDAYKLPGINEVPQLYSKAGSSILSINTLPEFTEESVVPVCIKVGNSGVYKIEANNFDLSEIGLDAYLEDLKEGFIIILDDNANYEFSSKPNDEEHRFNLIFKNSNSDDDLISSSIQIFSYDNTVQIRKELGISSDIYIYDIMGREVITNTDNIENKVELQILNGTGYYLVKVITNSEIQTKKVFIK